MVECEKLAEVFNMTQRQSLTLSLTEISTLKIDFLLEMFQLPLFFKSPKENRFFRSKSL